MRKKLIDFRVSLEKTLVEMAETLNVSKSFYEKIEYGERNPSFNFITKFKEEYPDANVDELFFNS